MRKEIQYRVTSDNRDNGKVFLIKEMPASQAEKWAIRAFLAMARNGIELPEGAEFSGMAGIAKIGLTLFAKIPYEDAEILLDEMFQCISIIPDPSKPNIIRGLIEDDIDEISTRLTLRREVFLLHVGFSAAEG